LRRRWSLKGRERMGSALFEKMECIFSIAPMGNLDKSQECSPDASRGGTRRCVCASGVLSVPGSVGVRHRTPGTGRGLDPVCASGVA